MAEDNELEGVAVWHDVIVGPPAGPRVRLGMLDMAKLLQDNAVFLKTRMIGTCRVMSAQAVGSGTILGSVIDLKEEDEWTLIPGVTLDLPSDVKPGDLILATAHCQVRYQGDVVGTNHMILALLAPVLGVEIVIPATAAIVSKVVDGVQPVTLTLLMQVGTDAGDTIALYGKCATATDNTFATVLSPWRLELIWLRPMENPEDGEEA